MAQVKCHFRWRDGMVEKNLQRVDIDSGILGYYSSVQWTNKNMSSSCILYLRPLRAASCNIFVVIILCEPANACMYRLDFWAESSYHSKTKWKSQSVPFCQQMRCMIFCSDAKSEWVCSLVLIFFCRHYIECTLWNPRFFYFC